MSEKSPIDWDKEGKDAQEAYRRSEIVPDRSLIVGPASSPPPPSPHDTHDWPGEGGMRAGLPKCKLCGLTKGSLAATKTPCSPPPSPPTDADYEKAGHVRPRAGDADGTSATPSSPEPRHSDHILATEITRKAVEAAPSPSPTQETPRDAITESDEAAKRIIYGSMFPAKSPGKPVE